MGSSPLTLGRFLHLHKNNRLKSKHREPDGPSSIYLSIRLFIYASNFLLFSPLFFLGSPQKKNNSESFFRFYSWSRRNNTIVNWFLRWWLSSDIAQKRTLTDGWWLRVSGVFHGRDFLYIGTISFSPFVLFYRLLSLSLPLWFLTAPIRPFTRKLILPVTSVRRRTCTHPSSVSIVLTPGTMTDQRGDDVMTVRVFYNLTGWTWSGRVCCDVTTTSRGQSWWTNFNYSFM